MLTDNSQISAPGEERPPGNDAKLYRDDIVRQIRLTWQYHKKTGIACRAFKKQVEVSSATGGTAGQVRENFGRPDPVRRSVARIAARNLYSNSDLDPPFL